MSEVCASKRTSTVAEVDVCSNSETLEKTTSEGDSKEFTEINEIRTSNFNSGRALVEKLHQSCYLPAKKSW